MAELHHKDFATAAVAAVRVVPLALDQEGPVSSEEEASSKDLAKHSTSSDSVLAPYSAIPRGRESQMSTRCATAVAISAALYFATQVASSASSDSVVAPYSANPKRPSFTNTNRLGDCCGGCRGPVHCTSRKLGFIKLCEFGFCRGPVLCKSQEAELHQHQQTWRLLWRLSWPCTLHFPEIGLHQTLRVRILSWHRTLQIPRGGASPTPRDLATAVAAVVALCVAIPRGRASPSVFATVAKAVPDSVDCADSARPWVVQQRPHSMNCADSARPWVVKQRAHSMSCADSSRPRVVKQRPHSMDCADSARP